MLLTILPVAAALVASPPTAGAGAKPAPRFEIVAVADGIVRLDTQTGAMTHCRDAGDGFACKAIDPDRPAALTRPTIPQAENKDTTLRDFDQALGMMERAMRSFMSIATEADKSCDL